MRYKKDNHIVPFINPLFEKDEYKGFRLNCPSSKTIKFITFFLKKGIFFDKEGDTQMAWYWKYKYDDREVETDYLTHQKVLRIASYWIKWTPLAYWREGEIKTFVIQDAALEMGLHLSITKYLKHNVFPKEDHCNLRYLVHEILD